LLEKNGKTSKFSEGMLTSVMPLAFVKENSTVKIVEVRGGLGLTRRLAELGLNPGSLARIVRVSPPGPMLIEVEHPPNSGNPSFGRVPSWRIAIGFGVAMKIFVQNLG